MIEQDTKNHADSYILDSFRHAIRSKNKSNCSPQNYIGHCCVISGHFRHHVQPFSVPSKMKSPKSNPVTHTIISPKKSPASPVPANISPSKKSPASPSKMAFPKSVPRLSGTIHFPEFDLFIDSPMDCMDIHAVGAESNYVVKNKLKRNKEGNLKPPTAEVYLPARWHRVVPHLFAVSVDDKAPEANAPLPESWNCTIFRNIKVKQPHSLEYKKVSNYLITKISIKNVFCSSLIFFFTV